ncbi:phytoene desaturase family protein [Brevundimonas denitrificans]|uniref:phytoene desaturase family protein n=1 Tax=Brevundimonas denitrificans TaxID=1443434 RepID=UPI00352E0A17
MLKAASVGRRMAGLDTTARRDLLDLFTKSAGDWLDGWFESDPVKALFGFDSVVGNYASPYTPGSAYVLLHHIFGEVNGKRGVWGHAIGGMGAITQAMAAACAEQGVDIRLDSPVAEVLTEKGRAVGAVTEAGETVRGRAVVSNLHPRLLFERLVDPAVVPTDFRERIGGYASGSGTFRMNVALSELPRFTCLPEPGDHLTAGIIIAPSLDYMDRAFMDARRDGWSKAPIVEMLIPSTLDDSLAPPGAHVASLFCQHVAPVLSGGRSWDDHRDAVADLMIDTVDRLGAGVQGVGVGAAGADAAGSGAALRPARRGHLPRTAEPGPAVQRAAGAGARGSPHAGARALSVRIGRASRGRRHRGAGAQCGAGILKDLRRGRR